MGRFCFGQILGILCLGLLLTFPEFVFAAEETEREMWWTVFVNWFPMLLVIGVWIYFMQNAKTRGAWGQSDETNRYLEKIEQTLERIARALEKK